MSTFEETADLEVRQQTFFLLWKAQVFVLGSLTAPVKALSIFLLAGSHLYSRSLKPIILKVPRVTHFWRFI